MLTRNWINKSLEYLELNHEILTILRRLITKTSLQNLESFSVFFFFFAVRFSGLFFVDLLENIFLGIFCGPHCIVDAPSLKALREDISLGIFLPMSI